MTVPPALAALYAAEAQLAHRADLAGTVFQLADVALVDLMRRAETYRLLFVATFDHLAAAQREIDIHDEQRAGQLQQFRDMRAQHEAKIADLCEQLRLAWVAVRRAESRP